MSTLIDRAAQLSLCTMGIFHIGLIATQLGNAFQSVIVMLGLVLVWVYVLLAPVNGLTLLLQKASGWLGRAYHWPKGLVKTCRTLSRAVAILSMYALSALTLFLMSLWVVPTALEQFTVLQRQLPGMVHQSLEWLIEQPIVIDTIEEDVQQSLQEYRKQKHGIAVLVPTRQHGASLPHEASQPLSPAQEKPPSKPPATNKHHWTKEEATFIETVWLPAHLKTVFQLGTPGSASRQSSVQGKQPPSSMPTLFPSNASPRGTMNLPPVSGANSGVPNPAGNSLALASSVVGQVLAQVAQVLGGALSGLLYVLTGSVLVFYLLLDGPKLKSEFIQLFPMKLQPPVKQLFLDTHHIMYGFVKGQVFLGIATGIFMMIVYAAFGTPFAFLLGLWFGAAEILPVVGTWIGFLPGILLMLFISPIKLLFLMMIVYIYQTIKDNIVAPKVIGDTMGLHPVVVVLSLLICSQLNGLIGVLFAIPLASFLKVILLHIKTYVESPSPSTPSLSEYTALSNPPPEMQSP
jgi:predicted PurR-regulated permease PerM